MIRRLIILLFIIGCVFGDTIKHINYSNDNKNVINNIEFLGVYISEYQFIIDPKLCYKVNDDKIIFLKCSDFYSVFDSNENKIEFDCEINTFNPTMKILTEHIQISTIALISSGIFLIILDALWQVLW